MAGLSGFTGFHHLVTPDSPVALHGPARRISQILFTAVRRLRSFISAINPGFHRASRPKASFSPRRANRTGRPFNPLFDLAPRGACHAGGALAPPRWSLAPPFHPYRLAAAVCSLWRFPSAAFAAALPALTAGPSALRSPDFPHPCGRDRSHARSHGENVKDRGRGCGRTLCRPPAPGPFRRTRRSSRCGPRSAPRTAAASCGSRRTRRRS